MFCSTIIPTIGRSSVSRAVNSVLEQQLTDDDFEVIVVNDSGRPLADASWQQSERVRTICTNRRERSVARNSGASLARGKYLHFLDDDDWILPNAFERFRKLAHENSRAVWLHGGIRIVDLKGNSWGELNAKLEGNCFAKILGGAWAPIQASLIDSDSFFEVGGYAPLVTVTQDLDLSRRIALVGDFASTHDVVAALLRDRAWGTSTNYQIGTSWNQRCRDEVLGQKGALQRLKSSSPDSFWRGRVLRIYVASVLLNLRRGRIAATLNRLANGLSFVFSAGPQLLNSELWRAMRLEHVPGELYHVLVAMENELG